MRFDTLLANPILKATQFRFSLDLSRLKAIVHYIREETSYRFANSPFDRMKSISTAGQMRRADVLTGWKQVADANGLQRSQWNLKRMCFKVDIVVAG